MDWTLIAGAVAVVAAFIVLKRVSFVAVEAAREYLRNGALVIDVRSPEEFRREHLPQAINVPLGDLKEGVSRQVKDKSRPLLLHCLSGGRSGIGKGVLKRMGYQHVFNLGSYSRAAQLVASAKPDKQ